MFDRIAGRYDLVNHLLSFRRDVAWRRKLAAHLPGRETLRVLDLATGTADLLIALKEHHGAVKSGVGLDMSSKMLAIAEKKISKAGLTKDFFMVRGDASALAISDETFDAVSIGFGIRNVENVPVALEEMYRILASAGRALILEFSLPGNRAFRTLYLFYFRYILPKLGGLISGDAEAYHYLNESVEAFPYGEDFCSLMSDAGFKNVSSYPMTFGIATLYTGDK